MRRNKSIFYSKIALMVINFIAIVYNASIYLFATNYVVAKGYAHSLLGRLDARRALVFRCRLPFMLAYCWFFITVRSIQISYLFMIK